MDELATLLVLEQGKTFPDAKGDILRGLQVVEAMCALPTLMLGDKLEVARDMDTYVRRSPLGVGAAICPFNFPAMIPLWSLPVAIGAGNTLSEWCSGFSSPGGRKSGSSAVSSD